MQKCKTCGDPYPEAGDGWDGECGTCADRSMMAEGKNMSIQLKSPTGQLVIGTLESLTGTAMVDGWTIEDGKLVPEYEGTTEIEWDNQHTKLDERTGAMLVVDEAGEIWSVTECEQVSEED